MEKNSQLEGTEAFGSSKATDKERLTLGSTLLEDYHHQESLKSQLNRETTRITNRTIGNKSKLPQQIRDRKKSKEITGNKIDSYIAAEEISDLDLFRQIDDLKNCCNQCDSSTNCIKNHFLFSSNKLDFVGLCNFVRKARAERHKLEGEQLDNFVQEKFRSVCKGEKVNKHGDTIFHLEWIHEGKAMCRQSYSFLFDIPKNRFDKCSFAMKSAGVKRLSSINHKTWKDDKVHDFTFTETEVLFKENLLDLKVIDESWVQAALSPSAEAQQYCIVWFQTYFNKFGDRAPNRYETYLLITAKRNVYHQYVEQFNRQCRAIVTESVFSNLWNTIFPRYINRPWCDIPGKCDCCYEIDTQRRSAQDFETQEQLKVAHHLHRGGMFNLERLRYKARCAEAIESNNLLRPTVMSLIIDGMDQNHCKIPYLGGQNTFKSPLTQHITGVKEHGVGLTLFRNFNNITKGADLTIYCVLKKLENFKSRHGYYPEKLFLQVDGGSENANQYLLAALELLVVKRCCRDVYYTRLPTGHTHEDIDAAFAVIWSCFCSDPCETLQSYKKRIEDAFNKTSLHATIEDVLVVPNYRKLLGPCITKGFARMHKEIHTQHQWRFFAVPVDPMFPLGCKTTFRAYSADQVVEFVKKPKGQCLSKVGRYTGLEPVTLFVRWYPTALCDPNRVGVEGLYILEKLPSCPVGMGTFIEPCDFDVGSSDYIKKCIIEVHRQWQAFDTHATILNDWNVWADTHAPKSDSAVEYVTNSRTRKFYNMPMRIVLFNPTVYMSPDNWLNKLGGYSDYDPNFKWPEAIAIAMNSVASDRFNPHPPEARVYSALDEQIVLKKQNFCDATVLYYDGRLKTATAKLLKEMLRRRVGYSGECRNLLRLDPRS
mmetsp:Transcript_3798/g.5359  ORF Transcript_3798/g.5359 Transcript_3798/m.5359 type:complete len:878 (-) Transcript_3798:1152-3785(-)